MKIKWLGHASFLITSDSGTRIITDPYTTMQDLAYGEIKESADIVTVSHDHGDHNNVAAVGGNPEVVRGTTEVKGIKFKGIPTYHDDAKGNKRGNNTMLCFEVDGLRICHNGDLGHDLTDEQLNQIGEVDILLLCAGQLKPIGERQFRIDEEGQRVKLPFAGYTIDCDAANQAYERLAPKVTIPIHCSNERCSFKIASVETFLLQKKNVIRLDTSEVELKQEDLAGESHIVVLRPAL